MKKIFVCLVLFAAVYSHTLGQPLIIKGRVKCLASGSNSSKGAVSVVVIPAFIPSASTQTVSNPSGYFEFNTGIPFDKLLDKTIKVYIVSKCKTCKETAKNIFVSEDQDRQNRQDNKKYLTIKDWMLNTNCQQAELVPFAADSVLHLVTKQPGQDINKVSPASALVGTPAFLNFITTLTTVVGAVGVPTGQFFLDSFRTGKIKYGSLLFSSPMIHTANTGFNFSPSRDMSEAVFWNPSAMAFARKPANISLLTNLKNNGKVSGYYQLGKKFTLGAGAIYTIQDEFRMAMFIDEFGFLPHGPDTAVMNLKEYAVFLGSAYRLTSRLSVGINVKSMWQDFNIPVKLFVDNNGSGNFTDSTVKKQGFDVDISATYKISNALQAGINLMNLAGTKLYADAFVPGRVAPVNKQRSAGLGFLYKYNRLNAGVDLLFTEDGFFDASLGINYVPFNNALISAGLAFKQLSYSVAFRLKHFRIAYINDNDWFANDKRKGKSSILNGKIYGGFVFDF